MPAATARAKILETSASSGWPTRLEMPYSNPNWTVPRPSRASINEHQTAQSRRLHRTQLISESLDDGFQLARVEPLRVAVACIFKIRLYQTSLFATIDSRFDIIPHVNGGLDHVEIVELQRVARIIARNKQLVQLFARTDSYRLLLAIRVNRRCEISDAHRRNFRDEYLATPHQVQATLDKLR